MHKIVFYLSQILAKMWVRCCIFCFFALITFFIGPILSPYIPALFKEVISTDAVKNILQIIASSMLAVTTFSLSIMVQAFNATAATATPRASKLLMEDATAQNALGAFIGAFLFSIVGIIGISAGMYDDDVIAVLFLFTLILIAVIIVMLLRWIDQLSRLGRVSVTIDLVETALLSAIDARAKAPYLNAQPLIADTKHLFQTKHAVIAEDIGYVQYFDIHALNNIALEENIKIYLAINPGVFLDSVRPFAFTSKTIGSAIKEKIVSAVVVGKERTFQQDPRYGFVVLSEIALRALSSGVNDPGTAISVVTAYVRAARHWANTMKECKRCRTAGIIDGTLAVKYSEVFVAPIEESDMLDDMLTALLESAGSNAIVVMHLKKALASLKAFDETTFAPLIGDWEERLMSATKGKIAEEDIQRLLGFK